MHSTVASAIGTSGRAIRPSVPDSGSNRASKPVFHAAASSSCARAAMRTSSHGKTAPMARNGMRKASRRLPPSSVPRRASHAVKPGRSEYAHARCRPSCQ
jgi:hypothetical protein